MKATARHTPSGNRQEDDPLKVAPQGKPRQAVLDACHEGAWEVVGGIPLIARSLYHLGRLGMEEAVVLIGPGSSPVSLRKWQGGMRLREVRKSDGGSAPSAILSVPGLDWRFLYLDAAHLIGPRFLETLIAASETTLGFMCREDKAGGVIRAGLLHAEDLCAWVDEGSSALVTRSKPLFPEDVEGFSPEIRGVLKPYFIEVRSEAQAREATHLVISSQQKFVMDLPAEYIDPFFENTLTYWLCQTPVTPNMVTIAGAAVAVLIAWLFWHGYFATGALLTFVVEVLDGVDGKLARTKLQFSWIGRQEAVVDYFCENSWYAALGVGLSTAAGGTYPYLLSALMILSDTVDNILYTLAGKWHGKSIDLFGTFDAAFRRIAGRRNIYGFMFMAGFLAGYPLQTFAMASFWAAVTATVHAVRLFQFRRGNMAWTSSN